MSELKTEHEFELPRGYVDRDGTLHRQVTMRLATAADEILPLGDYRVQNNQAYLAVIILSRVVTRLGSLDHVSTELIENLFSADFAFLQAKYNEINELVGENSCPHCGESLQGVVLAGEV